jgi:hypothetical protein
MVGTELSNRGLAKDPHERRGRPVADSWTFQVEEVRESVHDLLCEFE